jgi:hypothetical protein
VFFIPRQAARFLGQDTAARETTLDFGQQESLGLVVNFRYQVNRTFVFHLVLALETGA